MEQVEELLKLYQKIEKHIRYLEDNMISEEQENE